ncbi:MAG: hypothetical protein JSS07_00165 [Proteobacteria bacterium]|nr:hypothetical protein [Pseudomonadota bacterium]
MMKSQMTVLSETQTKQVGGGGHYLWWMVLESFHIFMGFREFYNYTADLWFNGCQNVEENDHFTQLFCRK